MEWLAYVVSDILARWGYLALAGGLLGEDAGLPLPGETILMYASFVAHRTHQLNILLVIYWWALWRLRPETTWDPRPANMTGPRLLAWRKRRFPIDEEIGVAANQNPAPRSSYHLLGPVHLRPRTIAGLVAGALNHGMEENSCFTTFLEQRAGSRSWR